ncbi:hypothetical protein GOODEAATRI_029145 [Goodea atripinnis]|uniref:Cation efflux protein transmembrane domain-containing protein n=1 Tax=Goodea atripinnis TaxID=208336 RepID=A0ABV0Q2N4_9TELE
MFSEAIHSLADTCNQALLALGISQSVRNPDAVHPYGFSNMRYIASLISGVGIFMMGAGLSWYHGIMGLLHPEPIESLLWAYCILAGSLVSEGATLLVAINEIKKSAQQHGMSFYEYGMHIWHLMISKGCVCVRLDKLHDFFVQTVHTEITTSYLCKLFQLVRLPLMDTPLCCL